MPISISGRKYGGAMVLQMAVTLQSKALLCLNNLIEIMNVDELGGCQALFEVWKNLATLSFSSDKDQVYIYLQKIDDFILNPNFYV